MTLSLKQRTSPTIIKFNIALFHETGMLHMFTTPKQHPSFLVLFTNFQSDWAIYKIRLGHVQNRVSLLQNLQFLLLRIWIRRELGVSQIRTRELNRYSWANRNAPELLTPRCCLDIAVVFLYR